MTLSTAIDTSKPLQHAFRTQRAAAAKQPIVIRGARQNNLKNLDLDIPTGELVVVTGVSGSGKSSLVFDTLYAEGQRRYVETFSPYARQFLDRMDRPQVARIDHVPPSIAIDQTSTVRSSRSTVGTMTELNDHIKLLFAKFAQLYCRGCGQAVKQDTTDTIATSIRALAAHDAGVRVAVCFEVSVPSSFTTEEIEQFLSAQGYTKLLEERITADGKILVVIQDRFKPATVEKERLAEAIEAALKRGHSAMTVAVLDDAAKAAQRIPFNTQLNCAACEMDYSPASAATFSFNSPVGACDTCRGFGRVIGIDRDLVIPDQRKTLRGGAVKVWSTPAFAESMRDLDKHVEKAGIPMDVPWKDLTPAQQHWVWSGDANWKSWDSSWPGKWYGVEKFFGWLESKAYKMHIRVLLSKYRAYTACGTCQGERLKGDAGLWRVQSSATALALNGTRQRIKPVAAQYSDAVLNAQPGLAIQDVMQLPVQNLRVFFAGLQAADSAVKEGAALLQNEINSRLKFLCDVGLGYLTLDRQSRTLSGGEVQRINLTTALGTSLTGTLFVLDEPSIGLHPRDMDKIIAVMHRLRDAGNSLVVVEHDPAVMLAADKLLDIGPGPGERGGEIVYYGEAAQVRSANTLTAQYLNGTKRADAGLAPRLPATAKDDSLAAPKLLLEGAAAHNLKGFNVEIPLNHCVVVTGVSGSGKSTLVDEVLHRALRRHFGHTTESPGAHHALHGADQLDDVVFVDQNPIGKSARSNPVSYVGAWDSIRNRFAALPESKERGYTAGTFSFNSGTGRCATCSGTGFEHVEMQFLSDVYLRCADCDGTRFRGEIRALQLPTAKGGSYSIDGVLGMTVSQAIDAFAGEADVLRALQPLAEVGLDYLKLGQPVPTLSGGEAQRLKLAGYLAESKKQKKSAKGTLYLFDEPTTGLHFDDIAKLLRAMRRLVDAGHSVLLVEHNLDVIRAADWVIELGPEGGDAGGEKTFAGSVDDLMASTTSHTAKALRDYEASFTLSAQAPKPRFEAAVQAPNFIDIRNATEHNLKNISVQIPHGQFTVITGASGSGKSTLAFDIVFSEGQRRYLESINAYARSMVQPANRPEVEAVFGIPPTVAIEQRTSRGGRKSTVATVTEIHHFLRLMYVKLGVQYCPDCDVPIVPQSVDAIVNQILRDYAGQHIGVLAPLVLARKGFYTDLAKWAAGKGHTHLRVDGAFTLVKPWPRLDRFAEHTIELPVGDMLIPSVRPEPVEGLDVKGNGFDKFSPNGLAVEATLRQALTTALEVGKGVVHILQGVDALHRGEQPTQVKVFSTKRACPSCATSFAELDPRMFSYNSKMGWCKACVGSGMKLAQKVAADNLGQANSGKDKGGRAQSWTDIELVETAEGNPTCEACDGQRLNPISLAVRLREHSLAQLGAMGVAAAQAFFTTLKLNARETDIAKDAVNEVQGRLGFLRQVGLDYLTLDRAAPTLSGGEAQRIRLAAQLGSRMQGVCYVLDEPTIGLHPRDNRILLEALDDLEKQGNTVIVVEHDEDTMARASHVIDIGPGSGVRGGQIVAQGTLADIRASTVSLTGKLLREPIKHPMRARRLIDVGSLATSPHPSPLPEGEGIQAPNTSTISKKKSTKPPVLLGESRGEGANKNAITEWLTVNKAHLHNLQQVTASIPLQALTVVTGVSGSGKSTFAREVLLENMAKITEVKTRVKAAPEWQHCESISGYESIQRVLEVDQTPIGKTPRSCPATYIGFWDTIRKQFADTAEARMRGYTAARFSFNTGDGRCEACEGQGMRTVEMSFLPDVKVMCDVCRGRRFNTATLQVLMRGKSVGDVLNMDVDEAIGYFENSPSIAHPLQLMQDVGLGYLTIGQPSPTLSGGEAQRIKLVTELAKARLDLQGNMRFVQHTLYVLDEPTVGLHMADVEKLLHVMHRMVDAGNTVVVIEHNLDVMAEADWLVDMGPEGGSGGGQVVIAAGVGQVCATHPQTGSHTGRILSEFLNETGRS
jgi:excinuclease ABC subunit A